MSAFRYLAATAVLAISMIMITPAQAITARQQALQGDGVYTTSKGVPQGYGGGYYPQDDGRTGYRRGYHPRNWGRRNHRDDNGD